MRDQWYCRITSLWNPEAPSLPRNITKLLSAKLAPSWHTAELRPRLAPLAAQEVKLST